MNEDQTVFVVDDEPAVAQAISRLLRSSGYTALSFESAEEFMRSYKPGTPGCLLLDISMPKITGLDVQQWMAASANPLPIIFLTALDYTPEKARAMRVGAVDILMKPVSAGALLRRVEEALARDREARKGLSRPAATQRN
jgi:FixJ family two-component response regulator